MDVDPTVDKDHLLVGLEKEKVVMSKAEAKKTPEKMAFKHVVKEVVEGK